MVGYDPSDPIQVRYGQPLGDEPTGAAHPELLEVRPSHGHDNTIINGISRIGYMTGGKAARWDDRTMADTLTVEAVSFVESRRDRPFFLYFATHDVHVPRVPHPRFRGTSEHGTRGAVIQELDWSVGQVLDTLDRLGLTEKTLVVFTSDNGGVMDDGYQDGSGDDTSGHRCNGDLRGFKGSLYEGGTRVPFIARWPGKVPAGEDLRSGSIAHVDLLATVASIVEQVLPDDAGPDSVNQLSSLLSEKPERPARESLVLHGGGGGLTIRLGSWKLIPHTGQPGAAARRPALCRPSATAGRGALAESRNLAADHPDRVEALARLLRRTREAGRSR